MQLATDDTAILLARGDRFDLSSTLSISRDNVILGAFGVGDKPEIRWTGTRDRKTMVYTTGASDNVVIRDITFNSIYSNDTGQSGMPTAVMPQGRNTVVMGCEFLHVGVAVNANTNPVGLTVMNNTAPLAMGLRDYFVWVQGSNIVIVGNDVENSTREHVIRINQGEKILIQHNRLQNLDRRNAGDASDTAKGALTVQRGAMAYIAQNDILGPTSVGPLGQADGLSVSEARWDTAVYENNQIVGSQLGVVHGAEHITIRGNMMFSDNNAFVVDGFNSAYNRGVIDVVLSGNTQVNYSANGNFLWVRGRVDGITLTDNRLIAPNFRPGQGGTAAVYVSDSSLASFRSISGNIWPSVARASTYAAGGIMFIGYQYNTANHVTPAEWNNLSQVGTDQFFDISGIPSFVPTNGGAIG